MKAFKVLISVVVAVSVALSLHSAPVSATTAVASPGDTPTCKFIYEYDLGKGFTIANNKVNTTVKIDGDANCTKDITLAVWNVPNKDGSPFPEAKQTLFDSKVAAQLTPGRYTLTASLPKDGCYYQVDLVLGTNPTGPNQHLPYENNRMLNSTLGGSKVCEPKTTPIPVTPVTTTPVTPVTPAPVTPAAVTTAQPAAATAAALPDTGAGSVVSAGLSVAAVAAVLHNLYKRRLARI